MSANQQFIVTCSHSYPELLPLAQLLRKRYPPLSRCLTWRDSSKVNVIVVDMKPFPEHPISEHVRDIKRLEQLATHDIPDTIALRVFLVEDVTAPVIELLGSNYADPHTKLMPATTVDYLKVAV